MERKREGSGKEASEGKQCLSQTLKMRRQEDRGEGALGSVWHEQKHRMCEFRALWGAMALWLAWPEGRLDGTVPRDEAGERHGQLKKGRACPAEAIRLHTEGDG